MNEKVWEIHLRKLQLLAKPVWKDWNFFHVCKKVLSLLGHDIQKLKIFACSFLEPHIFSAPNSYAIWFAKICWDSNIKILMVLLSLLKAEHYNDSWHNRRLRYSTKAKREVGLMKKADFFCALAFFGVTILQIFLTYIFS